MNAPRMRLEHRPRTDVPAALPALACSVVLVLGWGTVQAQPGGDGEVEGGITIGAGAAYGERALWGQYSDFGAHRAMGLLDADYSRRNDEAGTALSFRAVNLLGASRELELRWKKQGDWALTARLAGLVRHEPDTPSSGGLSIKRTNLGVGYAKVLGPHLQLELTLSGEKREGSRLWGIGMACPSTAAPECRGTTGTETGWALLLAPEPIDATHARIEARLSYANGGWRITGGYLGSFYDNALGSFTPNVPDRLNNPLGTPLPPSAGLMPILRQPVALPPDNQAHQIDLSGSYALTPTARVNFKLARARASQHQNFSAAGLTENPTGVADLGAKVDTTLAQLGISARPLAQLSLQAKLRYEDKDDRTPLALYNVEGSSSWTNRHLPSTRLRGELDASYGFSGGLRGSLGADYESIDRGVFTATSAVAGISALRQKTDEVGVHAQLRRAMNEAVGGSVVLSTAQRRGSVWLRDNSGLGVTEVADPGAPGTGFSTAIFMPTLADRRRDLLKLLADWQVDDKLSVQLAAQGGRDTFSTPSDFGLRSARTDQVSVDAVYAWSDAWNMHAFLSHGQETLRQARPGGAILAFDNTSSSVGIGMSGKASAKLQVGAQLAHISDRSVFAQSLDATADGASVALLAAGGGLPDIVYRSTTATLWGRYEFDKQIALRLDLAHQRTRWNDWAWGTNGVPFRYSDGSTVGQPDRQSVNFIAVRLTYRWL